MWVTIFLGFSEFQGEKYQLKIAGSVKNTELYRRTIENVFSELVTSAMKFLLILPENFPDS